MRRGTRSAWLLFVALAVVLASAGAVWASALPSLQPVVLPRDQGAHPAFQVEWWYTAGTVAVPHGDDYFWFATIWSGERFELAKLNLVDLRSDRIVLSKEYLRAGALNPGQTRFDVDGFRLGWRAHGAWGLWSIDAPVPGVGSLRLTLTPVQPYVLNGPHGIVATGTLVLGKQHTSVTGRGWFDHQWGNFATNTASWNWNWFACQFNDGSDLMLYQFISPSGEPTGVQSGTFVSSRGAVTHPTHYKVTPLGPDIHPPGATGTYPLRWRLKVPAAHVDIALAARARHQFIANHFIPGFWEGAAAITRGASGTCIVESTRETTTGF